MTRARKPRALKLQQGTLDKRFDHVQQVPRSGKMPPIPKHLSESGQKCWQFVVKHRSEWCHPSDALQLQRLCEVWEQLEAASRMLRENPGQHSRNAYGQVLKWWMPLAKQFGLDPQSRENLGITPEENEQDSRTSKYLAG